MTSIRCPMKHHMNVRAPAIHSTVVELTKDKACLKLRTGHAAAFEQDFDHLSCKEWRIYPEQAKSNAFLSRV